MTAGKSAQRVVCHEVLRRTSPDDRALWSAAICGHLASSLVWQRSHTVMLYAPMRYEPDLTPVLDTLNGKCLVLPSMENDLIVPRTISSAAEFRISSGALREPDPERCPVVDAAAIDLIMVPGLGFGRDGSRLGRGKGHYDRFLAALPDRTVSTGVCFACQVSATIPVEPHDVMMNRLLTQDGWTDCEQGATSMREKKE